MAKRKKSIGWGGILVGFILGAGVVLVWPKLKSFIPSASLARYR